MPIDTRNGDGDGDGNGQRQHHGVTPKGGTVMRIVGWFQLVVGTSMLLLWSVLLSTGQVPEVIDGRADIWFHLGAEVVAAALLLAGGTALLRRRGAPSHAARLLAGLASGALLYTAVNSAGYYAESGDWAMVGMFAVVTAATIATVWRLFRTGQPPRRGSQGVSARPPVPAEERRG